MLLALCCLQAQPAEIDKLLEKASAGSVLPKSERDQATRRHLSLI